MRVTTGFFGEDGHGSHHSLLENILRRYGPHSGAEAPPLSSALERGTRGMIENRTSFSMTSKEEGSFSTSLQAPCSKHSGPLLSGSPERRSGGEGRRKEKLSPAKNDVIHGHHDPNGTVILVTGASGFVGSGIIPHLLSRGFAVRALVREGSRRSLPIHPNLTYVLGDMRDLQSLQEAVKGVDCVIHLAAAKADEAESEAINVGGARNLAEACLKSGVKRMEPLQNDSIIETPRWEGTSQKSPHARKQAKISRGVSAYVERNFGEADEAGGIFQRFLLINVSTQSTKLKRKGLYGRTKEEAERILHASGIPVVTLRCSVLYSDLRSGIFGSLLAFTRLPVIPIIGSGEALFRPLHTDDLAEIVERCMRSPAVIGRMFDVGGPDAISFNHLIDEILRRQNRRRLTLHLPGPIAMALATLCSFLPHPPITRSNVLGADEQLSMHPEELWQLIGFVPRTLFSGLDELFRETAVRDREKEARALLSYVMSGRRPAPKVVSGSGKNWIPSTVHVSRFLKASEKLDKHLLDPIILHHPFLLGALDAITRLRFPHCTLQKKMLIAAAIVECSPESAEWLLPKERSMMTLLLQIAGIALLTLARFCIALPLLAFPSFTTRNAGR